MVPSRVIAILAAGFFLVMLSACDNSISPLADDADRIFAIHGFLDSAADTQFVRISALRPTILADNPPLDDIEVRSLNRSAPEALSIWTRMDEEGEHPAGDLFAGAFKPDVGNTYTLQVIRAGDVAAQATTTLPSNLIVFPQTPTGDSLNYTQVVVVNGIRGKPLDLKMKYEVQVPESPSSDTVILNYDQEGELTPDGWLFYVFLKRDRTSVSRELGTLGLDITLGLRNLGAVVTVRSDEFNEPDNPNNLDNAHGFFGSIGHLELNWTLDEASLGILDFEDQQTVH